MGVPVHQGQSVGGRKVSSVTMLSPLNLLVPPAFSSESDLFNKLERIALSDRQTTPVIGCTISRALETQFTRNSVSRYAS